MPEHPDGYARERAVAVEVAREAGAFLRDRYGQVLQVDFKGATDLVTDVDRASEALISERLLAAFPGDQFLGEEGGSHLRTGPGRWWVVDPLDGTTNFAHGYPLFAISIALVVDGTTRVGVVYLPLLDEVFSAGRGEGATLNGQPIRASRVDTLEDSLLATGFPYERSARQANIPYVSAFLERARALRRSGVAAFDLCCVACGRFEGYWERGASAWDVAAGALIVEEAGGVVTDYQGGPFGMFDSEVLAATTDVHDAMLAVNREIERGQRSG